MNIIGKTALICKRIGVVTAVLLSGVVLASSPADAHGTQGANHTHDEGIGGVSLACVDLGGNPLGYYKNISVWPSVYWNDNGNWHMHTQYWDNKGHLVGGGRIATYSQCGF